MWHGLIQKYRLTEIETSTNSSSSANTVSNSSENPDLSNVIYCGPSDSESTTTTELKRTSNSFKTWGRNKSINNFIFKNKEDHFEMPKPVRKGSHGNNIPA